MSGYKYSTVDLDRQRERQLRLLSSMNEIRRVLDWLAARIREHLEMMPEGIKASFAGEVEDAASWLHTEEEQGREAYDMRTEISTLTSATSSASALLKRGHEIRNTLALDLARRSDAMAKAAFSRIRGSSCFSLASRIFGFFGSLISLRPSTICSAVSQRLYHRAASSLLTSSRSMRS